MEPPSATDGDLAVLAIGASAAETGSLVRVLTGLPPDAGIAVVLALQNREALDENAFRGALAERADALTAVADGTPAEAGQIYLPAPNVILTLEEGRFRTRPAEQAPGARGTIDSFFVSLAQDQDGKTIGLVLAGTGSDGTLGVTAVKEAGGLALAETTPSSQAGHLAASSSPAALADLVLPADEIPARIVLQVRDLARREEGTETADGAAGLSGALTRIAAILRDKTGHDFHGYKRNTFLRRVQRRMQVVEANEIGAYLDILRTRPDEAQLLFNDLLIGVTQFFRDRREFEFLEAHVIPKLFNGKGPADQVRVWVLGCATGEEAYSIAILLREFAARQDAPPQLQIFASDIDGRALAVARVGRYPHSIANDVTPERLARWFLKEGNTYSVVRELREACIFSQHSVIRDTPFSRMDLVSCRNLLIYLDASLQNQVIPLFHFALRPGGFLFLGNAENVAQHARLFAPVDRGVRIFERVETARRSIPDFPFMLANAARPRDTRPQQHPHPVDHSLIRQAERLAERYAPSYAIVDEQFDVLHFSGNVGRFIQPPAGAASLNLPNLVHGDLRLDLQGALGRAGHEKRTIRADGIQVGMNGQRIVVDLVVDPIQDGAGSPRGFVVLFKDGITLPGTDEEVPPPSAPALRQEKVRRLETELHVTRERLQAAIEELESTNEELKASNEEYQSLNEELQSANEELATSKEELQSFNEELTTVNGELAQRIEELGRANSDLKNLLESTQIATVFLDNDLRVTNFTPAVAEIFHLVETDIGRPLAHVRFRIAYDELHDDIRRVARTLAAVEREVENPATQARYIARVLPYRSVDNFIAGSVVTFTDITPLSRARRALRDSEERLLALVQASSEVMFTMSPDWSEMRRLSGSGFMADTDSPSQAWLTDYIYAEDRPQMAAAIEEAVRTRSAFALEHRVRRADGSLGWALSRAVPLLDPRGEIKEWFGAASDVTARKEAEAVLRQLNDELEVRFADRTAELMITEEQLRQSQKMEAVGQLTGGVAHDFNNMLQGISGSLELLERRIGQGRAEEVELYLQSARGMIARAAALTHRLLAFARRQTLLPKPVQPDALIEDMAELIRRTVGPGVQVELRLGDGIWPVLCDPNQLENALLNLAINARDAMPGGGTLTVSTRDVRLEARDVAGQDEGKPGDYVEIAVADPGVGMDEATQARVFEPFFTTKPMGQGTGLGLSQLYGFVRQSGGIVRLESKPGQGTTVRLYLPRHDPAHARDDRPPSTAEPDGTGTGQSTWPGRAEAQPASAAKAVLLVEDEAELREIMAGRLRELGYEVLEAADGPAALRLLQEDRRADLLGDRRGPAQRTERAAGRRLRAGAQARPVRAVHHRLRRRRSREASRAGHGSDRQAVRAGRAHRARPGHAGAGGGAR